MLVEHQAWRAHTTPVVPTRGLTRNAGLRTTSAPVTRLKSIVRNGHREWLSSSNLVESRGPKRKSSPVERGTIVRKRSRLVPVSSAVLNDNASGVVDDQSLAEDSIMHEADGGVIAGLEFSDSDQADVVNQETQDVTVTPVLRQSDTGIGRRKKNAACFYEENKAAGGGLDCLVGVAAFDVVDLDPGTLAKDEVSMHANTAAFAGQLSRPNRDRLANLTKQICDVQKKQTLEEVDVLAGKRERPPFVLEPLQTPNEIRMQFFDQEKSLFDLLPHPPLFECEGHTCSLCSDCIRDALGKGFDSEVITASDGGNDGHATQGAPVGQVPTTRRCRMLFDLQDHMDGTGPLHQ